MFIKITLKKKRKFYLKELRRRRKNRKNKNYRINEIIERIKNNDNS